MKQVVISMLMAVLATSCIVGCSHKNDTKPPISKTFLLVHGAWQGPYVWQTVKTQLEAAGQKVVVVELPAHADDTTSPANVSINVYRDKVIAAIQGLTGNIILVGHSMGGVVVTAVAEAIPARIEKLVYIGAFLPANGQSLFDLASQDAQSQLGASLIPSADQLTLDVKHENIISIFCQDAPAAAQQQMLTNYRVESAIPFTNRVTLTATNFGSVNKYYIHTLQDHAIGINLQYQMAAAANIKNVDSLNTGHSPFLSQPGEVTQMLLSIIQ